MDIDWECYLPFFLLIISFLIILPIAYNEDSKRNKKDQCVHDCQSIFQNGPDWTCVNNCMEIK